MAQARESRAAEDQMALAARLRETREYLNLSQQFVSAQTGIPRSAISDIERGLRKVEAIELKMLSELYRFPVGYFVGEIDEEEVAGAATLHALGRAANDLTEKDREEVLRFALFLKQFGKPPASQDQ